MVRAVRRGKSLRQVAATFGVSAAQVAFWVKRAAGKRLDRVDFANRLSGPRRSPHRTAPTLERRILHMRRELRTRSVLGEYGAEAIQQALQQAGEEPPSRATINRILLRHGATDSARRVRRPSPPPGWYLPGVASGEAELDSFDVIEDLKIADGPLVMVLTGIALHGRETDAWPAEAIGARQVVEYLIKRWHQLGLPHYAQFDNDTRFQGAHQFRDTVGRVSRLCLSLGVVPVFAPPREHGIQNLIEHFNGLWQNKVWARWPHPSLAALQRRSRRYICAHRTRSAARREHAPARRALPADWRFDPNSPPQGRMVFLRRTNDQGAVSLLGHYWALSDQWSHRLVRCEVDLSNHRIDFYALRRRDPLTQPLLHTATYHRPDKPFRGNRK